jgi:hypothetical protein
VTTRLLVRDKLVTHPTWPYPKRYGVRLFVGGDGVLYHSHRHTSSVGSVSGDGPPTDLSVITSVPLPLELAP